jgi:hypothetical protein
MPHFTFPLSPDGMIVQAMFGLNGAATAALVQTGQPVARPIQVRSLLDNGTDATAIAPHVFQKLGLKSQVSGTSQTAAGQVTVNLYRVSLGITGPAGGTGSALVLPDLLVSELTATLPNIDALIGMDVLRQCLLVLDGPGQQFILGF